MKTIQAILEMLEKIPLGLTTKLKIGENDYALQQLRKQQPKLTMDDIKRHNEEAREWEKGFEAAIEQVRKWRNKQYLKLKNLS